MQTGAIKECHKCHVVQPLERFWRDADAPDGLFRFCKQCGKVQNQSYYRRNSATIHRRKLRARFGITDAEYEALLDEQNGGCAICGRKPTTFTRRLAVDHDHVTGRIRGLLCGGCNRFLLGTTRDNPTWLRRAADYLERSST